MNMRLPTFLIALLLASVALAGCADDDGSDTGDDGDTGTGGTGGTGTDGDDDNTTGEEEPEELAPIYINGTISQGLVDCDAPDAALQFDAKSHSLPPEAAGGSYELSVVSSGEENTGAGEVTASNMCVAFEDGPFGGTGGASGTIPEGAGTVYVGANQGYAVEYSIMIQPVPQEDETAEA